MASQKATLINITALSGGVATTAAVDVMTMTKTTTKTTKTGD